MDFNDVSIFQGIVEFSAYGCEMSFENDGGGYWIVRILTDGAWVYDGKIKTRSKTPKGLYYAWEKRNQELEDDELKRHEAD
jgi:hypothetical protein